MRHNAQGSQVQRKALTTSYSREVLKTHPQRLTSVQYFLNFFAIPFHFTITKSPDVCELLSPLLFTCIVRIALRANKFVSGNSVEVLYRHLGKPPLEEKKQFCLENVSNFSIQVSAYGTFVRQTLPGTSGVIGFSPWWQGQLPPDILAPVDGGEGGACKWAVQ